MACRGRCICSPGLTFALMQVCSSPSEPLHHGACPSRQLLLASNRSDFEMNAGGVGAGPVAPSTIQSSGRPDTPLQPGILVLAIGAPVLFAVACFLLMCVVWRRLDLRHWRGLPPEVPKQAAAPAEPRRIKIPVVIMQPDTRVDVGYILRAQQAQQADDAPLGCHEPDGGDQRFSVVTVMEPCGPLWRAMSMTPSDYDAPGSPHIGTICGPAGPPCEGAVPNSSPGPAQLAAGELPVGFALSPLPAEGAPAHMPSPPGMPPLARLSAKAHSRRGSWGAAVPPAKGEPPRRRWSAQPSGQAEQQEGGASGGGACLPPAAEPAAGLAASSEQQQMPALVEPPQDAQPPGRRHACSRSAGSGLLWQRG